MTIHECNVSDIPSLYVDLIAILHFLVAQEHLRYVIVGVTNLTISYALFLSKANTKPNLLNKCLWRRDPDRTLEYVMV